MLSIGAIIWVSVRPLLRLILCVGFGFIVTKADIFPSVAARACGQILLTIALPCLMFSKIVPSFSLDNINTLGPLFLVAFLYEAIGLAQAWIVKQLFWVPHRFRHGMLVAGAFGNVGDLPTAVIMSICAGPPFNGTTDANTAVAYISTFIFVFFVTLFPLGGSKLIALDFVGPEVEDEEVKEAARLRRKAMLTPWKSLSAWAMKLRSCRHPPTPGEHASGEEPQTPIACEKASPPDTPASSPVSPIPTLALDNFPRSRHALSSYTATPLASEPSRPTSPSHSITHADSVTQVDTHLPTRKEVRFTIDSPSPTPKPTAARRFARSLKTFAAGWISPASIAVVVAFPVALVPQLKGLFLTFAGTPIPNAPDGQPPLAFIMDTATFVGAASVPLGLICLGSALARLKVPRGAWGTMPLGAICSLAVMKVIISPILGVLICQGLTNVGVIDHEDKVLRFVCIFFSCLPTATTQVYLTQVYSGTGSAEHVSAFLIPQYAIMILSMTILTAYSLNLIF